MNSTSIEGLLCTDHNTYCTTPDKKEQFIAYWAKKGLRPSQAICTVEYPAEHIALVPNPDKHNGCDEMIGLSVSNDPKSPVQYLAEQGRSHVHGGVFQHTARLVSPGYEISEIRERMENNGIKFMTPILCYKDSNGAELRQMFTACERSYGPFIEIIQRTIGKDGKPFQNFSSEQIDTLYAYYDAYSKKML